MSLRSRSFSRSVSASLGGAITDQCFVESDAKQWYGGTPKPPLIIVHGAGFVTPYITNWDSTTANYCKMTHTLAKYFTVYTSDLGGDWWGSPDHVFRISEAKTYMENNYGTSGKLTLVGFSMGGLGALNWARINPSAVRAVVAAFPVISLNRFRTDTPGALAQIDACYSGGYSDATYGSQHNPALWASSLDSSIPVYIPYSDADTTIPHDTITTFKADRPATTIEMVGSNGHGDLTIGDALPHIIRFARSLVIA